MKGVFMNKTYLLNSKSGQQIYESVRDLPIIDYHCHLSPKEIYEDKPFNNIGEMWLGGDHYKWRLMRAFGIDEEYITGKADWHEKFLKYAETISLAAGNPLYHWTEMELNMFFGIEEHLCPENAEEIWNKANAIIKEKQLSPRKLIKSSNVEYIATTDDIADSLEYHEKLAKEGCEVKVAPSYRTDNLLQIRRTGYADYIAKLSDVCKYPINNLETLKKAATERLDFFKAHGCKMTDVGIPDFPDRIWDDIDADKVFTAALKGKMVSDDDYKGFLGNMYRFFGKEYQSRGLIMQWHLAVWRNANSTLFKKLGADCGGDCMGDDIAVSSIIRMLDAIESDSGLPKTILYSLKPNLNAQLCSAGGSFRNVVCGAAWWFCDHKRGIEDQIETIAETGHLASFLGMLTDSRSFLSYARHDYFRRILCEKIGKFVDDGEFDGKQAEKLAIMISYSNIKSLVEDK